MHDAHAHLLTPIAQLLILENIHENSKAPDNTEKGEKKKERNHTSFRSYKS